MHKKVTATVLTNIILVSFGSSIVVSADTLQQKLEQQNKEMKTLQSELSESQKIVEKLNSKIEEFDYEIENTLYEIDELNNQIELIEGEIQNAIKEIEQAEEDMKAEKDLYNSRMSAMYISGRTGFIEVLLGSKSLSDLFTRIQIIKKLTELDNEIIFSLKAKKVKIEKSKTIMEEEILKLDLTLSIQEEKMAKLQESKDE